jgi:nitrous oxidase accessory protein NosD
MWPWQIPIAYNSVVTSTKHWMAYAMKTRCTLFVLVVLLAASAPGRDSADADFKKAEPLVIDGKADLTISGLDIANPKGNGITIRNSKRIRIENCKIGQCNGEAVNIYACDGVTVSGNRFEAVSTGVYALESRRIEVIRNRCLDVRGPFPRGQLAQFDKVTGGGNRINQNVALNVLGKSSPEDVINIYKSSGTPDDPIQVIGNKIRGGGPSDSGGGIMTGDGGGAYIVVRGNILVDPGQYGIAIAGGHHIQILGNKVFGKGQPFTNVGIYVWNQSKAPSDGHTVKGNQVRWFNKAGIENPCWDAKNCGTVAGWDSNDWHADLHDQILPRDLLGRP